MAKLTFREQCALVALEAYALKVFDDAFKREATDAGLEVEDFLAAHCWGVADAMVSLKDA
jgi:hypothetical protein